MRTSHVTQGSRAEKAQDACLILKNFTRLHAIRMMSHAHLSSGSRPASSPFCSSSTFSSSTSSVTPCRTTIALRKEDYGRMASYAPPEVMSPTGSTSLKSSTTRTSIFHSSDPDVLCHIDDDRDESVPAEIENEQIRVAFARICSYKKVTQKTT